MKIKINENYKSLKESYLFSEIAKRVNAYVKENPDKKVIRLGIGDVTLPLPKTATDAMQKAVQEMTEKATFRGYAPEYGYDFIREAISKRYKKFNVEIESQEVFVSDGAKSDVGNIVDILGDNKILIPNPVYPVYLDSNIMSGRKVEFLEANIDNQFLPMPPKTREEGLIIYLCSPNNPTGAVYNFEQLKKWVQFARQTGSLIIFDAAYESFIVGEYPHSIYEIDGAKECAIEVCSFSKMAGFTGTRCAWMVVPKALESSGTSLNKLWARRQATKFNGVPYMVQRGAEAVLTEQGEKECNKLIAYYMQNAKVLADLFTKKGIYFTGGISSPYIWLKCPKGMSSWEFFDYLLQNAQIVGTPGAGFGSAGESYFRLSSFGDKDLTVEAAARLDNLL
ncbi:MAG: LL-diaminopimelate aminotransferase [Clostridiales bacterium]|nr:LL-diaminopimelate aminotransferase [Clostridiales bacterium]